MNFVKLKFEPRDIWVGVYVDTNKLRLYVCAVPMFPIIIGMTRDINEQVMKDFKTGARAYISLCMFQHRRPKFVNIMRAGYNYAAVKRDERSA